ncbi:MAG: putative ABC transporter permease [Propionicimonas sp.]|nr:putative ABC transporter permease [Propionicimonas sp.]
MVTISSLVLAFACYSFLGWVLEGTVLSWSQRRLINPGFLTGPFVPIYAVGALGIQVCTAGLHDSPVLVFVIGTAVATVVEFIGHLLLQRLFGLVLWDYSGRVGSIQGRVCLLNSLGFGVAALAVVYVLDPLLQQALAALPVLWAVALASALATVFIADWGHSIVSVLRVRPEIRAFQGSLTRLRDQIDHQVASLGTEFDQARSRRHARLLQHSRNTIARLEAAFPGGRTNWLSEIAPLAGADVPPGAGDGAQRSPRQAASAD